MQKLEKQISQLESKIPYFEKTNSSISSATVGWQIEHSLKTILIIFNNVKNSNPENYKWKFNKIRLLIYVLNKFPRGKANAPKIVLPEGNITEESLKKSLLNVKNELRNWDSLPKNAHFPHPYFGKLNKKSTEWFLNLHTKHHLKIINDICK